MLFETALVITMTGLMTHVGNTARAGAEVDKQCVAMVVDQHHEHSPSLRVRKCFLEERTSDFEYRIQRGDRIEFSGGVTAGHATADVDFVRYTPSLTEPLTNSAIAGGVEHCEQHDRVAAWLVYPAGELRIAWYHLAQARFRLGEDVVRSQCVPRGTWFVAPTSAAVDLNIRHRNGQTTTVKLKPSALVEISNESDISSTDDEAGTRHFGNYGGLMRRRYGVVARRTARVEAGDRCTNEPTLSSIVNAEVLARLVQNRFPAMAAALRDPQQCGPIEVGLADPEHPACTNTDYP